MKYKFILAFALMFIFAITQTSATEVLNAHGVGFNSGGNSDLRNGVQIVMNQTTLIVNITRSAISTATHCYIYDASKTEVASGTFTNTFCSINYSASKGSTYYAMVDKDGVSYTRSDTNAVVAGVYMQPALNFTSSCADWNGLKSCGFTEFFDVESIATESIIPTLYYIKTDLQQPLNGDSLLINQTNLTISVNISNYALVNATFVVWNSTGDFFRSTNTTFNATNGTKVTVTDIIPNSYSWDVYVCGSNTTGEINCSWSDNGNFTLKYTGFTVDAEVYNKYTNEGNLETFQINVTMAEGFQISTVNLVYNETSYEGTLTNLGGGSYSITRDLVIPDVDVTLNQTFNWSFLLDNGFTSISDSHNQSIRVLGLDDCSVYTYQLFNFTLYDEKTQLFLSAGNTTSIKLHLTISSLNDGQFLNYSHFFDDVNSARVCLENPLNESSYRLDGLVEYDSLNRFTEFYHIQNYSLTNTTNNKSIALYNLNTSQGTEFKITYKDSNFVAVVGALMHLQRKYVDEGLFKTIEIPKTGTEGYTIGHLVRNDAIYNILIYKEGILLATFEDVVADCQNPLLSSCEINLNELGSSSFPESFASRDDFVFSLTYNTSTREVKSIFSIPSGVPSTILMNVTLFDSLGNRSVCSDSLLSSGGQLDCIVPSSFENSTIVASLYKDGNLIGYSIISARDDPTALYGGSIIFVAVLVFLVIMGIGASSDNPMIFGIILIVSSFILVTLNIIYSPSVIGVGATILWFVIAIAMLLIKGSNRT